MLFVRATAVLATKRAERHDCTTTDDHTRPTTHARPRTTAHDRARTTMHDHAWPITHTRPRAHDRSRTTTHDWPCMTDHAWPTTHDRPRMTDRARPFEEAVPTPPQGGGMGTAVVRGDHDHAWPTMHARPRTTAHDHARQTTAAIFVWGSGTHNTPGGFRGLNYNRSS